MSLCRKYGLYLVMAHQTWNQTSERLRGALQNAGAEVAFKLGRSDAEYSSGILGRVDPLAVKHEIRDERAEERGHPVFYSLPEQWEAWAQAIQDLKQREAFVLRPNGKVARLRTLSVPDPKVDANQMSAITERYLTTYFRPQAEIEQDFARYRQMGRTTTTRMQPHGRQFRRSL